MDLYSSLLSSTFAIWQELPPVGMTRKIRTYKQITMSKVFQVKPKRIKRTNGTVLTPEMVVTVTTQQHTTNPFYNGAKEL